MLLFYIGKQIKLRTYTMQNNFRTLTELTQYSVHASYLFGLCTIYFLSNFTFIHATFCRNRNYVSIYGR